MTERESDDKRGHSSSRRTHAPIPATGGAGTHTGPIVAVDYGQKRLFKIAKDVYGLETAQRAITEAIFGKEAVEEAVRMGWSPRRIYETSTCDSQCNSIVGKVSADNPKTKCWICGIPIRYYDKDTEPGQCEHILPIIQAVMYLGLYTGKDDLKDTNKLKRLKLEYQWAHEKCNLLKNDYVYLKTYIDETINLQVFAVDVVALKRLLRKIWRSKPEYVYIDIFDKALHMKYATEASFLEKRLPIVTERLQKIADHLNSYNAPGLIALTAAVNLYTNFNPKLESIFGTKAAPRLITLPKPRASYEFMREMLDPQIKKLYYDGLYSKSLSNRRTQIIQTFDNINTSRTVFTEIDKQHVERIILYVQYMYEYWIIKSDILPFSTDKDHSIIRGVLDGIKIKLEELRRKIRPYYELYKDIIPDRFWPKPSAVPKIEPSDAIEGPTPVVAVCSPADTPVVSSISEGLIETSGKFTEALQPGSENTELVRSLMMLIKQTPVENIAAHDLITLGEPPLTNGLSMLLTAAEKSESLRGGKYTRRNKANRRQTRRC